MTNAPLDALSNLFLDNVKMVAHKTARKKGLLGNKGTVTTVSLRRVANINDFKIFRVFFKKKKTNHSWLAEIFLKCTTKNEKVEKDSYRTLETTPTLDFWRIMSSDRYN